MKVCYFGTYRANYSRNQIMIAALRAAGVEVVECHVPLWRGIEDRVVAAGGRWASWAFVKRVLGTYRQLLIKYAALEKDYEVLVLGYPGQLDAFLARLLAWFHRKPLVMDLFMSIYLIALERGLAAKSPLSIRLLRLLERIACRLPDMLISDTEAYKDWHCQIHGLRPEKFGLVPTGYDDRIFKPCQSQRQETGSFNILYYGTFIPNHCVETIIEAANLLKTQPDIYFELAGDGPTREPAQQLAATYNLTNVTFSGWVERDLLPRKIAGSDVVLGVFGLTPQSLMTIQNKIYESLAVGSALISGHSPTVRDAFTDGHHLLLVERGNPSALAEAIMTLYDQPALRTRLALAGCERVQEAFSLKPLGVQFRRRLETLLVERSA
jgi:glycosyltransferase involved in cell wall biosynthesis